jgi:hypothetical protein
MDPHPVAYLSNRMDGVALDLPGCLRAIVAIICLVQETTTLGQQLEVLTLPPSGKGHPRTKKPLVDVWE